MNLNKILAFVVIFAVVCFGCKKESFITSSEARLLTSTDSIKFDTVFTSVGSVTQSFKIINDNSQQLKLSVVKLMGGTASPFRININGTPGPQQIDININANDSIYVFVTVTVNPSAVNLPFILSDSIVIQYNGNTKYVQLQAYGQNAVFLNGTEITSNTILTNTKPYVILGGIHINPNVKLIINAGTKIYSHANAPILVDGSLIINGTKNNQVVFSGDRLDDPYKNFPASWPGIYLGQTSKDNVFTFAIIKNAYQAVVVQEPSVNANPKLLLTQCIVDNAFDAGLLLSNTNVQVNNSLITNCGNNIAVIGGGNYNFTNCTIAAYSNAYLQHKNAVVTILNYAESGNTTITNNLAASFTNCILWGDSGLVKNEIATGRQGSNSFTLNFNNCLYRVQQTPANATFTSSIINQTPLFDSIDIGRRIFDFHISSPFAPGKDAGVMTGFLKDLDDNPRVVGNTDIGSYEKQ